MFSDFTLGTATTDRPSIDAAEYNAFMAKFNTGRFGTQRLGQAFFNHFNLHRMNDQHYLGDLYEKDGMFATKKIQELFSIE